MTTALPWLIVLSLHASGRYHEHGTSAALPGFPLAEAVALLQRRNSSDETSLVAQFRSRIRGG